MKSYYIRVRNKNNPPAKPFYIPLGLQSQKVANDYFNRLYGDNMMLEYATKEGYEKAIQSLRESGAKIYS